VGQMRFIYGGSNVTLRSDTLNNTSEMTADVSGGE